MPIPSSRSSTFCVTLPSVQRGSPERLPHQRPQARTASNPPVPITHKKIGVDAVYYSSRETKVKGSSTRRNGWRMVVASYSARNSSPHLDRPSSTMPS